MSEKSILPPKLKSPDKPEQPEEGFVPYVSEVAEQQDTGKKRKIFLMLSLILLAVVILIAALLLILPRFNRYHKVMKNLSFDYRDEIPGEQDLETTGQRSIDIAKELTDQPVRVKAACYLLNSEDKSDGTVAEYEYLSSLGLTQLKTVTSAKKSLKSKTKEVRTRGKGYELYDGSDWKPAEKEFIPDLRDYFFGITSHDNVTIGCYDTYQTTVNGKSYVCEVWLIDEDFPNKTVYSTLYRYYDGNRLAGVIVLHDTDDLKEVYDISSYEINPKL